VLICLQKHTKDVSVSITTDVDNDSATIRCTNIHSQRLEVETRNAHVVEKISIAFDCYAPLTLQPDPIQVGFGGQVVVKPPMYVCLCVHCVLSCSIRAPSSLVVIVQRIFSREILQTLKMDILPCVCV